MSATVLTLGLPPIPRERWNVQTGALGARNLPSNVVQLTQPEDYDLAMFRQARRHEAFAEAGRIKGRQDAAASAPASAEMEAIVALVETLSEKGASGRQRQGNFFCRFMKRLNGKKTPNAGAAVHAYFRAVQAARLEGAN